MSWNGLNEQLQDLLNVMKAGNSFPYLDKQKPQKLKSCWEFFCSDTQKNRVKIDIWKISIKKQMKMILTYFIHVLNPGKPTIGKFFTNIDELFSSFY